MSSHRYTYAMHRLPMPPCQWEQELDSWENNCVPDADPEHSDEEQQFDYNAVDEDTALCESANMLILLKVSNRLNAREVCTLVFWRSKAGLGGLVRDLAVHPQRPSGNIRNTLTSSYGGTTLETMSYMKLKPLCRDVPTRRGAWSPCQCGCHSKPPKRRSQARRTS